MKKKPNKNIMSPLQSTSQIYIGIHLLIQAILTAQPKRIIRRATTTSRDNLSIMKILLKNDFRLMLPQENKMHTSKLC